MAAMMSTATSASGVDTASKVVVLIDGDQFFQKKHMRRLRQLPVGYEFHLFSAAVYPSGARKSTPKAVVSFCAELTRADRVAVHEVTYDTTKDAADRLMIKKAAKLHAELPSNIAFLYVTNDKLLAQSLGSLLVLRPAVHWHHLNLS